MKNKKLPKSPAQAYREATADVAAYRVGVALRIIWEVSKPIIVWSLILTGAMVMGVIYFLGKVLFDGLRP